MSDVGDVAKAVTTVSDLVANILDRSDRDEPEGVCQDDLIKIQNAFAGNTLDSDDFRVFIDELCNRAGKSLTPTGDVKFGRRELFHALLVITAESIRDKKLLTKAIHALMKKTS